MTNSVADGKPTFVHEPGFRLIDRVLSISTTHSDSTGLASTNVVALWNFTGDETLSARDHRPQVSPACFMLEAMAQTAHQAARDKLGDDSSQYEMSLASVNLEFPTAVLPGENIRITTRVTLANHRGGFVDCRAEVDQRLVAHGRMTFSFLRKGRIVTYTERIRRRIRRQRQGFPTE